jgi:hypothetical protein
MTYREFDLPRALGEFGLTEEATHLFAQVTPISPSEWLQESLRRGTPLAQAGLEKARSEFLIAPLLAEVQQRFLGRVMLHSGRILEVDKARGLTGECDFIFASGSAPHLIRTPILAVVEAKKEEVETGLGQCITQMVASRLINQQETPDSPAAMVMYGCVTTGNTWQFLRLQDKNVQIDIIQRYIIEVGILLGIFDKILTNPQI